MQSRKFTFIDSERSSNAFKQFYVFICNFQGETLEPLAQKNAVPRKHGMQILGKVPSARRPPANLPSLKAETLTPTPDQSGSWPGKCLPISFSLLNSHFAIYSCHILILLRLKVKILC